MTHTPSFIRISLAGLLFCAALNTGSSLTAAEKTKLVDLGGGATPSSTGITADAFMMGSTSAEKAWATVIDEGAQPGTARESAPTKMKRISKHSHTFI